jgi:hypothetical protein
MPTVIKETGFTSSHCPVGIFMLTNPLMLFWEITDYGKKNTNRKYTTWTKCKFGESGGADKQHCPCKGQKNTKLLFTVKQ